MKKDIVQTNCKISYVAAVSTIGGFAVNLYSCSASAIWNFAAYSRPNCPWNSRLLKKEVI